MHPIGGDPKVGSLFPLRSSGVHLSLAMNYTNDNDTSYARSCHLLPRFFGSFLWILLGTWFWVHRRPMWPDLEMLLFGELWSTYMPYLSLLEALLAPGNVTASCSMQVLLLQPSRSRPDRCSEQSCSDFMPLRTPSALGSRHRWMVGSKRWSEIGAVGKRHEYKGLDVP